MPQLLTRRRRLTRPTKIQARKPAHHITHIPTYTWGNRRSTSSSARGGHRRWCIEKSHNIRHAAARLRWRTGKTANGSGTGEPIWCADAATVLCAGRGAAVKVDIEKVLDVVLLSSLGSSSD